MLAGLAFLGLAVATSFPAAASTVALAGLLGSPLTIWAQTIRMRLTREQMRAGSSAAAPPDAVDPAGRRRPARRPGGGPAVAPGVMAVPGFVGLVPPASPATRGDRSRRPDIDCVAALVVGPPGRTIWAKGCVAPSYAGRGRIDDAWKAVRHEQHSRFDDRSPGGFHRSGCHGRGRHLRPARRGGRRRRRGGLALILDRRGDRRSPGLLVGEARHQVPVGGWSARVRRQGFGEVTSPARRAGSRSART